ncbi:MAG: iron-sulfur cluster assembly protein [Candidatus Binatia bacterium]
MTATSASIRSPCASFARVLRVVPGRATAMVRPRYEEVDFTRDCEVVQIPQGTTVTIEAGTPTVIMQDLGDSYTIQIPTLGGLYRVAGKDADALGKDVPVGASAESDPRKPVDQALVRRVLQSVYDPEIPVNIVDLGLVYALHIEPLLTGGALGNTPASMAGVALMVR